MCCNGIVFELDHPPFSVPVTSSGDFIFEWAHMIPIPTIGWGLYSQWSLSDNTTVLGSATQGGQCIVIVSECEEEESVDWSVNQMGTTKSSVNT